MPVLGHALGELQHVVHGRQLGEHVHRGVDDGDVRDAELFAQGDALAAGDVALVRDVPDAEHAEDAFGQQVAVAVHAGADKLALQGDFAVKFAQLILKSVLDCGLPPGVGLVALQLEVAAAHAEGSVGPVVGRPEHGHGRAVLLLGYLPEDALEFVGPVGEVLDALLVGLGYPGGEVALAATEALRAAGVEGGAHLLGDLVEVLHAEVGGHVVADVLPLQFGEYANWHHQPLADDAAQLHGPDADGLLQRVSVLVAPGAEAAFAEEGIAFVVGWKRRVDLEIDGAVAGAEFVPRGDDAPGLALKRDHVEAVGVGDGFDCRYGGDGCEFSHR